MRARSSASAATPRWEDSVTPSCGTTARCGTWGPCRDTITASPSASTTPAGWWDTASPPRPNRCRSPLGRSSGTMARCRTWGPSPRPTIAKRSSSTIGAQITPTSVIAGTPVTVAGTVQNQGSQVETFQVNVTAGGVVVGTVSVSLPSGASRELSFVWNTSGVAPGSYLVVMETAPLAGETDLGDNVFAAGTLTIAPRPVFAEASATPLATDVEIRVSFTCHGTD